MNTFSQVWVFSDTPSRLPELMNGAQALANQINTFVLNDADGAQAIQLGANHVWKLNGKPDDRMIEDYAGVMADTIRQHGADGLVLLPNTRRGKLLAAKLGYRLKAAVSNDASTVSVQDGKATVKHMVYGGLAVGVKELIELPKSVIEDRFQLQGNQGAACLFAGSPTDGLMGGGFLYTNENTLSLGLVCGLHHLHDAKKSVPQMLEDFKQHPAVAPLIAGGKLVEYSAHVVPEAGINMLPELVGDGVLIAGDAAGMCMNLGFTIRGMDLAIAAGEAAAKTVLSAMKSDDFSKQKLAEYRQHLESGPLRDMRMYQKLPAFLDNPRMFSGYPELAVGVARDLFTIDGSAPELMRKKILRHGKKVGFINLIKDGMKGVTVL